MSNINVYGKYVKPTCENMPDMFEAIYVLDLRNISNIFMRCKNVL